MEADILAWTVPAVLATFALIFFALRGQARSAGWAGVGYAVLALAFAFDIPQTVRFAVPKAAAGDALYMLGLAGLARALSLRYAKAPRDRAMLLYCAACIALNTTVLVVTRDVNLELLVSHLACGGILLFAATRLLGVARRPADTALLVLAIASALDVIIRGLVIAIGPGSELVFESWRGSVAAFALQLSSTIFGTAFAFALLGAEALDVIGRLGRSAATDPLTGLLNRRGFEEGAAAAENLVGRTQDTLILIDLDRFKTINDRYGHEIGDGVLVGVAEILRHGGGERSAVARLGGEEFAVLLFNADASEAERRAQQFRATLAATRWPAPLDAVEVTASFGITSLRPGEELATAIHRADLRLYHAKESGRNRVVTDDSRRALGDDTTLAYLPSRQVA